jgi:hypothetical protein
MRIYLKFSSRLIEDLYQDTCHEGYEQMILGLLEILDKFSRNLEITDYHSILSKLSFCYNYSEDWDETNQRSIYLRESYPHIWERVLKITDSLLDIWPQVLCRRDADDVTEYFGYCDHLETICRLTR